MVLQLPITMPFISLCGQGEPIYEVVKTHLCLSLQINCLEFSDFHLNSYKLLSGSGVVLFKIGSCNDHSIAALEMRQPGPLAWPQDSILLRDTYHRDSLT